MHNTHTRRRKQQTQHANEEAKRTKRRARMIRRSEINEAATDIKKQWAWTCFQRIRLVTSSRLGPRPDVSIYYSVYFVLCVSIRRTSKNESIVLSSCWMDRTNISKAFFLVSAPGGPRYMYCIYLYSSSSINYHVGRGILITMKAVVSRSLTFSHPNNAGTELAGFSPTTLRFTRVKLATGR